MIRTFFFFSAFLCLALFCAGCFFYAQYVQRKGRVLRKREAPFLFSKEHPALAYLICYTFCFSVLFCLVFAVNLLTGRGLAWRTDALPQYLPYLRYMGEYIRDMAARFLQGDFTVKMFDFTIGMGEDIRTVLQTHPLEFLSALVPARYVEVLYNFLMVFRFYLAGLTFSLFCHRLRLRRRSALIASFVYVFSGYTLYFGARHPIFGAPLVLLPLLMLTLDLLIRRKRPLLFTAAVAVSMCSNFYFLYMITFALGVYALLRFPLYYKENRGREFAAMMGRIIFYYLLGCGLAAVSLLPTIIRTFSSSRLEGSAVNTNLLFYGMERIPELFLSLISSKRTAGYGTCLNFAVPVLPILAFVFASPKKEYRGLKISLALEAVAMLIPGFAFMMSGFSNINNRWTFIVAFTAAFAVAKSLEDFARPTRIQRIAVAATPVLYGLCFIFTNRNSRDLLLAFLLLTSFTILYLFLTRKPRSSADFSAAPYSRNQAELCSCKESPAQDSRSVVSSGKFTAILGGCLALSLIFHGWYLFGNPLDPYAEEFMKNGSASRRMTKSAFSNFNRLPREDFYRVDSSLMSGTNENASISLGYHGVSLYNSVISGPVISWHREMENTGISAIHRIWSLDGRSSLEALSGVRYYMTPAGETQYVPYGFVKSEEFSDDSYWIYENETPLPLGYTYRNLTKSSGCEDLSALEKSQLMLESAVLSDRDAANALQKTALPQSGKSSHNSYGIQTVRPQILSQDDAVQFEDGICKVKEKGAGFTLSYEKRAGYEAYLHLTGLEREVNLVKIQISTPELTKEIHLRGKNQTYSLGRSDYLVNLGFSETSQTNSIRITFASAGEYALDDLELCYVPMKGFTEKLSALQEGALENVQMNLNTVSGTASLDENGFMVFSIPYSAGWKAYVDGQETALYQANTAFMGLTLTAGEHEITLRYTTPGIRLGLAISLGCLAIFLLVWGAQNMRHRKNREK